MSVLKRIFGLGKTTSHKSKDLSADNQGPDANKNDQVPYVNADIRSLIEKHAENMPPQAKAAFLKTFSQIESVVNAGKTHYDCWWYDVDRAESAKIVAAVCETKPVRAYLAHHGIKIDPKQNYFRIRHTDNPPAESFGAKLLDHYRKFQAEEPERRKKEALENKVREDKAREDAALAREILSGM